MRKFKFMEILIKRTYFREHSTVGFVQVNGKYVCDVYEPKAICWLGDKTRGRPDDPRHPWPAEEKVAGETAIPEGRYRLTIEPSEKYKRDMICLGHVPHFKHIYLRNTTGRRTTRGDLLLGDFTHTVPSTENYEMRLKTMIREALANGEKVWLRVVSPRRWGAYKNLAV